MTTELTLRDFLNILRRRAWLIALSFIGALLMALLWSALQTPMYQSSARILINQNTANDIFDPVTGAPTNAADRLATNEVELLKSQLVRNEAERRLEFPAVIWAQAEKKADIVVIFAADPDPVRASNIAQTYAESYLDVRRNEFIGERLETAEKLLDRIDELDATIANPAPGVDTARQTTLRDDLADSYDRLIITANLGNNGSARIIDDAEVPDAPFRPRTSRTMAMGGALGLLLGAGASLLLENLDTSIKSRRVIEETTPGLPALASIPAMKAGHEVVALEHADGLETEVFRTLRAGIEFASVDRPLQIIQITSAGASAGKTTVAANLAVVMAQSGQRVAVVDCDLRRPRLHTAFGIDQVPGFSSVIIGQATGAAASHALSLNNGRLWVFPSGPIPPGPSELLGSQRAQSAFASLRESVDVIIVDSPPVLPVSDALVLSRLVDATVVVANARSTKRQELLRALDQLDHAGANVIGTVLNEVKANADHGYGYGYGYGYSFGTRTRSSGLFSRSTSRAPGIDGTAMLDRKDLPRFDAAKRTVADDFDRVDANVGNLPGTSWLGDSNTTEPAATDFSDLLEESVETPRAKKRRRRPTRSEPAERALTDDELEGWADEIGVL